MSTGSFSLDIIDVARPCDVSWNSMIGDHRSRFCPDCRLRVYNLSSMSLEEASDLVQRMEGRLCARFYRRRDGTVITRDCLRGMWTIMEWLDPSPVTYQGKMSCPDPTTVPTESSRDSDKAVSPEIGQGK